MNVVIIGASGGIGAAILAHYQGLSAVDHIFATYHRKPGCLHDRVSWQSLDVTDEDAVAQFASQLPPCHRVINCVGMLHTDHAKPEKTVRRIKSEHFLHSMAVNALPSLLLARYLEPVCRAAQRGVFASVSARVGSIEDNRLGGWYSYRCSKAALNMALKCLALEWQVKMPNWCVLPLHPGTTDTELSKPFQTNVPAEKLFTPQFAAAALVDIIENASSVDTGSFIAWDGKKIPW